MLAGGSARSPSHGLTYETWDAGAGGRRIAAEWDALLQISACHPVFASSTWFLRAAGLNAPRIPVIHLARRGGALAGVLPLWLDESARIAFSSERLTDSYDMVVQPGDVEAAAGLLKYAAGAARPYRQMVFANVRRDANLAAAVQSLDAGRIRIERLSDCLFIPLPESYPDFLAGRSAGFRQNLRYAKRRANAREVEVRMLHPDSFPPARLAGEFIRLHLARFGADSVFETSVPQQFLTDAIPPLFLGGHIRACGIYLRSALAGVNLFVATHDALGDWNSGYLPELAPCSPGRLMIDAGVQLAYRLRVSEYDFLRGDEEYKRKWGTHARELLRYVLEL